MTASTQSARKPREKAREKARRLEDPVVNRWYENVGRGSVITADTYLRSLFLFCRQRKTSPQEVLSMSEDRLHANLQDFVSGEQKRGQAGGSTLTHVKAVKSWLAHNGRKYDRPLKVKNALRTPTLENERVPTQDELRKILLGCTSQTRASSIMMAHSGLRPEVLGNYKGTDGLMLADIPDLRLRGDSVEFTQTPAMVMVRPELSKAGNRYLTFISEEGCGYIQQYLAERVSRGEKLTPQSELIHARWESKRFVRSLNISDGIREGIRAAMGREVKMRPYALRAYFDTQLLLAESKGKVAHDYRVFWMGHKGSMEARYTTNKGRLPQSMLDDMREAYKRCEPFLSTIPTRGAQETQISMVRVMLTGLGYDEKELESLDLLDPQVFQELVRQKVASKQAKVNQKLVEASELPQYLEEGWTVVTAVNGHQVVLNPPGL